MGLRNRKKETLDRLGSKTLEAQFLHEVQDGLNCSPFEARAVLDVVKEVYLPFLDPDVVHAPPGKITPSRRTSRRASRSTNARSRPPA